MSHDPIADMDWLAEGIANGLQRVRPDLYATLVRLVDLGQSKREIVEACHFERYPVLDRALVENMVHVTVDHLIAQRALGGER